MRGVPERRGDARRQLLVDERDPVERLAQNELKTMTELTHDQFAVVGQDRGSYWAMQMALGYP